MKMKKWLTLALAGAMTLSFAACTPAESGDDNGSKAPGTSTGTDVSHPADSLWNKTFEGVTLKRLLWYEPGDAEKSSRRRLRGAHGCTIEDTEGRF